MHSNQPDTLDEESTHAETEPPADPGALARDLLRIVRRKRWLDRVQLVAVGVSVFALIIRITTIFLGMGLTWDTSLFSLTTGVTVIAGVLAGKLQIMRDMAATLEKYGGVDAIGPIVECSRVDGMDTQIVADTLTQLLPKLTPVNAYVLTARQRGLLFEMLNDEAPNAFMRLVPQRWEPFRSPRFRVILLESLAQIGDPAALPYVLPHCYKPVDLVRPAAIACRASLDEAARVRQDKQTLLRPAAAAAPDLLRPAHSHGQTESAQLLRPPAA